MWIQLQQIRFNWNISGLNGTIFNSTQLSWFALSARCPVTTFLAKCHNANEFNWKHRTSKMKEIVPVFHMTTDHTAPCIMNGHGPNGLGVVLRSWLDFLCLILWVTLIMASYYKREPFDVISRCQVCCLGTLLLMDGRSSANGLPVPFSHVRKFERQRKGAVKQWHISQLEPSVDLV